MALRTVYLLSLLLAVLKLAGYFASGSLIVLASFFDSVTDALISYLNYLFYRRARQKPDTEHPFGHGGFEVISSLLQGVLIGLLALMVGNSAIRKILWGKNEDLSPEAFPWVIGIMIFSALAGYMLQAILGRFERRLSDRQEFSLTVKADRSHYMSDFWTNGLGAIGLISVVVFKEQRLDSLLALAAAGLLLRAAYPLLKHSLQHIMQSGAEPEVQRTIVEIALNCDPEVQGIHRLRTRHLGPSLFIDFHLKLPAAISLHRAHDIGDAVEAAVLARFPQADVLVHLDPDDIPDEDDLV